MDGFKMIMREEATCLVKHFGLCTKQSCISTQSGFQLSVVKQNQTSYQLDY